MEQLEQISEHPFRVLGSPPSCKMTWSGIQSHTERCNITTIPNGPRSVNRFKRSILSVEEHLR